MSDNKKPIKLTIFPISAAIWKNSNAKGDFFTVTFERSYKDDAGHWQSSSSFNPSDLLLLAKVADQAHSKIYELRNADRKTQPEDQAA